MQVEGIYTAEPRFEAKAKALKLKQEMAAAAAEEQRVQKEKQYAQERNYGGGFGSGAAYMAGEKPEKTADTGFSGGQRGGFGSQHVQEPQTVQDTDTTLGWKLLRILNAGSGKFFSGFGQAGSKIVDGLEEVEQYLNGGWTSDGQYVKGDSPIVSSLLGWVHGAADDVTAQANAELDRSARNWSDTKAGQVFNEVAVNTPDKQWFSTKDENAVFNPKRDARQLAADAATAALVEGSGYATRRFFDEFQLSEEDFDKAFERGYNAEEEWKGQNDQAIRDQIRSEPEKLIINPEKQARHVRESKGYIPGRSYVTVTNEELQELVKRYAGKGEIRTDKNGKFNNKEIVTCDRIVGFSVDPVTGVKTPTNQFYIHYSNTGVHIVPTARGKYK